MALRFRKSIKLAPGIRWNLGASGSSWTFGPRGASIGVGQRGTYLNTGIAGTGLSSRTKLSGPSGRAAAVAPASPASVSMTCGVRDDGALFFHDASGAEMPEHLVELAKKQNKEAILGLIQRKCDEINEHVQSLGRLHYETPDSRVRPRFIAPEFPEPEPVMSKPQELGILDKLFKSRGARVRRANQAAADLYDEAMAQWRQAKAKFVAELARRKVLTEVLIYQDVDAMEAFLEERLQGITWPRETEVAVDIKEGGARVMLDVDLPEVEDMPTKLAAMPSRGLKLSVKEQSATKVQRLYAEHIHGILFRLVGEVFAALPRSETVVASGYSQRRDPATGQLRDDYLLSVQARRSEWEQNDFEHLSAIDVTQALDRFELRRNMLKSGMLKPIVPFD
jgi:hypothetical protein